MRAENRTENGKKGPKGNKPASEKPQELIINKDILLDIREGTDAARKAKKWKRAARHGGVESIEHVTNEGDGYKKRKIGCDDEDMMILDDIESDKRRRLAATTNGISAGKDDILSARIR